MIKSSLNPPTFDQATIDHYVAKGRRARSNALLEMVRALFSRPAVTPSHHDLCSHTT